MNFLHNEQVTQKRLEYRLKRKQKSKVPVLDSLKQQITENTIKECDICKHVKTMREFKVLVCNHHICKSCFYEIRQRNKNTSKCPFCREKLAGEDDVKQIIITISIPSQNRILRQTNKDIIFPYRINTICEIDSEEMHSESNDGEREEPITFNPLNIFDSNNEYTTTNYNDRTWRTGIGEIDEIDDIHDIDYINMNTGYVIIQLIYRIRGVIYGICLFFFLIWNDFNEVAIQGEE